MTFMNKSVSNSLMRGLELPLLKPISSLKTSYKMVTFSLSLDPTNIETSWKFVDINPVLKSPPGTKQPKEMKLGLSAYYRCSKFTAFPRGTLAAQLRQGVELKYNK